MVSHIDSHDHVHMIPWLFGVVKKIQREFGIQKLRIPIVPLKKSSAKSRLGKEIWRRAVRLDGTQTSDACLGLAEYRVCAEAKKLSDDDTIELMVHPGLQKYREETNLLYSDWWAEQVRAHTLISYDEL
jgi:predicted glycoside hydrolase/deacetylase ChbG (UPF0249 family)